MANKDNDYDFHGSVWLTRDGEPETMSEYDSLQSESDRDEQEFDESDMACPRHERHTNRFTSWHRRKGYQNNVLRSSIRPPLERIPINRQPPVSQDDINSVIPEKRRLVKNVWKDAHRNFQGAEERISSPSYSRGRQSVASLPKYVSSRNRGSSFGKGKARYSHPSYVSGAQRPSSSHYSRSRQEEEAFNESSGRGSYIGSNLRSSGYDNVRGERGSLNSSGVYGNLREDRGEDRRSIKSFGLYGNGRGGRGEGRRSTSRGKGDEMYLTAYLVRDSVGDRESFNDDVSRRGRDMNFSQRRRSNSLSYRSPGVPEDPSYVPNYVPYGIEGEPYHTCHTPNDENWGISYSQKHMLPTISSLMKAKHPEYVKNRSSTDETLIEGGGAEYYDYDNDVESESSMRFRDEKSQRGCKRFTGRAEVTTTIRDGGSHGESVHRIRGIAKEDNFPWQNERPRSKTKYQQPRQSRSPSERLFAGSSCYSGVSGVEENMRDQGSAEEQYSSSMGYEEKKKPVEHSFAADMLEVGGGTGQQKKNDIRGNVEKTSHSKQEKGQMHDINIQIVQPPMGQKNQTVKSRMGSTNDICQSPEGVADPSHYYAPVPVQQSPYPDMPAQHSGQTTAAYHQHPAAMTGGQSMAPSQHSGGINGTPMAPPSQFQVAPGPSQYPGMIAGEPSAIQHQFPNGMSGAIATAPSQQPVGVPGTLMAPPSQFPTAMSGAISAPALQHRVAMPGAEATTPSQYPGMITGGLSAPPSYFPGAISAHPSQHHGAVTMQYPGMIAGMQSHPVGLMTAASKYPCQFPSPMAMASTPVGAVVPSPVATAPQLLAMPGAAVSSPSAMPFPLASFCHPGISGITPLPRIISIPTVPPIVSGGLLPSALGAPILTDSPDASSSAAGSSASGTSTTGLSATGSSPAHLSETGAGLDEGSVASKPSGAQITQKPPSTISSSLSCCRSLPKQQAPPATGSPDAAAGGAAAGGAAAGGAAAGGAAAGGAFARKPKRREPKPLSKMATCAESLAGWFSSKPIAPSKISPYVFREISRQASPQILQGKGGYSSSAGPGTVAPPKAPSPSSRQTQPQGSGYQRSDGQPHFATAESPSDPSQVQKVMVPVEVLAKPVRPNAVYNPVYKTYPEEAATQETGAWCCSS